MSSVVPAPTRAADGASDGLGIACMCSVSKHQRATKKRRQAGEKYDPFQFDDGLPPTTPTPLSPRPDNIRTYGRKKPATGDAAMENAR